MQLTLMGDSVAEVGKLENRRRHQPTVGQRVRAERGQRNETWLAGGKCLRLQSRPNIRDPRDRRASDRVPNSLAHILAWNVVSALRGALVPP